MTDDDMLEERRALVNLKSIYEARLTHIKLRIKLIDGGLKDE